MLDLQVGYVSGNADFITVQTLGVSFEGGCAASVDYLNVANAEEKGIRITRKALPLEEQNGEQEYLQDYPIVRAEDVSNVVFVKNGVEFLMFRDRYGELVTPTYAALFSGIEVVEHVAAYLAERIGASNLPQSVIEKMLPPDDGGEDAELEDLAAQLMEGDKPSKRGEESEAASSDEEDDISDVLDEPDDFGLADILDI